jgi:hypothetical protein
MNILIYLLNIFGLLLIAWLIFRVQSPVLKKLYWPALLLKIIAGLALGWIYFEFYQGVGDTVMYHKDGKVLADLALTDLKKYFDLLGSSTVPHDSQLSLVAPRAFFFSKIVSVFSIVANGNYWIISVYFSFISFLAAWYLFQVIARLLSQFTWPAAVAFLFFPSVIFWSSGIIKESVACSSMFFLSALFVSMKLTKRISLVNGIIGAIAFWLLWTLKYHYGAILLGVMLSAFFFDFITGRIPGLSTLKRTITWMAIIIVPFFLITFTHPNFDLKSLGKVIVENNLAFQRLSNPDDLVEFYKLSEDAGSIAINAPWACFSGLFRPFIWESQNLLQVAASFENLVILVLAVLTFMKGKPNPDFLLTFGLAILTLVIVLSTFITLSSPNFGTLSRYRVGYEAYFLMLVLSTGIVGDYLKEKSMLFNKL